MSRRRTEIPEELRHLFEGLPKTADVIRDFEANPVDFDRDPRFVAGYAKAEFVNDLCAAMEARNLSQKALADLLGESRQYVSRVLNERANFTIETMAKFACALGLNLEVKLLQPGKRVETRPASRRRRRAVQVEDVRSARVSAAVAREEAAPYERNPEAGSRDAKTAGGGRKPRGK